MQRLALLLATLHPESRMTGWCGGDNLHAGKQQALLNDDRGARGGGSCSCELLTAVGSINISRTSMLDELRKILDIKGTSEF
uniref:Uncharacterized protein n=1 Tax=Oryza meridionalis TaxID=40149 RepID=A0A0E0D2P1_9ORYZ